jgi:hypothetical protein
MRTFIQLKPGVAVEPVEERLRATFHAIQEERAKTFLTLTPQQKELFQREIAGGDRRGGAIESAEGLQKAALRFWPCL